ncbi:Dynein light chain Tctex-type 1 [Lemmus lemmus]
MEDSWHVVKCFQCWMKKSSCRESVTASITQDRVIQLGDALLRRILVPPLNNDDRQKELDHYDRAIESAIGGNAYQHSKVNQWTTNVVEQTLSHLTKLGKPFKYIGASSSPCLSVFPTGSCTVRWENKTMYCIVSAFGLSI